jgi:FAD/FMN-containing dehydrogenase
MREISRRGFLCQSAAAAGALVVGFDLSSREWAVAGQRTGPLARGLPDFAGALRVGPRARDAAADDFGHIVHRRPLAVLEPASVDDVVKMIRFARREGIAVSPRGEGHSAFGQAQVRAGVVIDMSTLDRVHKVGRTIADIEAGVTWRTVLDRTLAKGVSPPALTDYQDLSVGGTLSVGGIGGAGFRHGAQVDNVLALEVVTGAGRRLRCSRTRSPALFDAVLAGLGQCALITRAVIRVQPAAERLRQFDLLYADLGTFAADARTVVRDGRFDTVQGLVVPSPAGGWAYLLEATSSSGRRDDELLAGLRDVRPQATIADKSFAAYAKRLDPIVEQQRRSGDWRRPHPWFDAWLPDRHAEDFAASVLSQLTLRDTGGGPILLYPTLSEPLQRPLLRVPSGEMIWQFDILRTTLATTATAVQMVEDNRRLFERVRQLGGYAYPVGAIGLDNRDWERHFGAAWPAFARAKRRYDPAGILTPGQGVFAATSTRVGAARSAALA